MVRFKGIALALALYLPASSAADRLRGSSSPPQEAVVTASNEDNPFNDIQRAGIDRSLASIHIESELSLLTDEQLGALGEYITRYSKDGNTDIPETCPLDYEGDVDPYHPDYATLGSGRSLMGEMDMDQEMQHAHMHYVESSCNAMIEMVTCENWSQWIDINNITLSSEVKIPCGECVTLDAGPGQDLAGLSLDFEQGLNIVGKLVIPSGADIQIITKYVFVQGLLEMPPPPAGTPISSEDSGPRVKITLYGTDEITFTPDEATDNSHLGGEKVSAKAFVVAGGRVDVRALDANCPGWVKLQSVTYGEPLPNVALGKPATQSSTYNSVSDVASMAVDGNYNSFTHTQCHKGYIQWWRVDLEDVYTIASITVGNRLDCCGGRFHDATFYFYDENDQEVYVMPTSGGIGSKKTFSVPTVDARYVKVMLADTDCLQIGEFEVYGWRAIEGIPLANMDRLHVGEEAANCWKSPGSRIMLTSDTYSWDDSHVEVVADVPSDAGTVAVYPLAKKKSAVDETFGYPDFAVEVALLDRSLVIEGAKDEGEFATLGGHFIVLHTPHVHQHLEGALLQNMGQQGKLGRYPLHFHMSECVHGSTLSKNVIWKSNQRCVVVHGTHNVTVSENVAFDTQGHCFMLEDGGEWDNVFYKNLGAKVARLPRDVPRQGETDFFPSVFWITNPSNDFIGNVAAGSQGPGFWFELKLRAPSSELEINHGINPKVLPQKTFKDNASHSSGFRAGFTTYETGYRAPPGTVWENIKAYKNNEAGLFQHGTTNIDFRGGLLADNGQAAHNFHHDNAIYDGTEVIGRSEHMQFLIDQGRIGDHCKAGGLSLQPNEGLGKGTVIKNSSFKGFNNGCSGGPDYAIHVGNNQVRNGVFDASPTIFNNSFAGEPVSSRINACWGIHSSGDNFVRTVVIEDEDGSLSGTSPGFFVQNHTSVTSFIDDTTPCQMVEDGCLLFCENTCLRLGIVSISQDLTTRGFQMHISDGSKMASVNRGNIWFDEKQNHLSAPIPLALPAAATGSPYQITFTDANGEPAWPGYATLNLERAPSCSGGVTAGEIEFKMPEGGDRCVDLFKYDDYPNGIHGWQNFFAGLVVSEDAGKYVINTTRRKDDRGHVNLSRNLDVSCLVSNIGRTYHLFGKMRMKDASGNDVASDGNSNASPKLTFSITGGQSNFAQSWNIATTSDGNWAEFSEEITLPIAIEGATRAQIIIDKAEKMEFFITEWGMDLMDSEAPTVSPTALPSLSPSVSPTSSPTASLVPTKAVTLTPTKQPVTAAPVSATPTNLALSGLASADSECWNGFAYKIIDGNANSINHNCCNKYGAWLMVDLGLGTLNYVEKIVVKNRVDCCGGRLKKFHVELLDADKTVVHAKYHEGTVGNAQWREFVVDDGTVARFARIRHDDSIKDCLHIGELEVWGYPTEVPASPEPIIEMATGMEATASSQYNQNSVASKSVDGNINTIHHSKCNEMPWWRVDLGVMSFVQDVKITNRQDCCGGRLRHATVELLDEDLNLVESRYIEGSVGNGQVVQKVFNEETSEARYVQVSFNRNDCLHMAEVNVYGYHLMAKPTSSPTPVPMNLALGKPATQSSTYNSVNDVASMAVDGNYNSFTHTQCHKGYIQWWRVDLEDVYTIASITVGNRLDCCGGRFHDATFYFYDENDQEVYVMPTSGGIGSKKTFSVDFVSARYIKVMLADTDCLQIGEFEAWGW